MDKEGGGRKKDALYLNIMLLYPRLIQMENFKINMNAFIQIKKNTSMFNLNVEELKRFKYS